MQYKKQAWTCGWSVGNCLRRLRSLNWFHINRCDWIHQKKVKTKRILLIMQKLLEWVLSWAIAFPFQVGSVLNCTSNGKIVISEANEPTRHMLLFWQSALPRSIFYCCIFYQYFSFSLSPPAPTTSSAYFSPSSARTAWWYMARCAAFHSSLGRSLAWTESRSFVCVVDFFVCFIKWGIHDWRFDWKDAIWQRGILADGGLKSTLVTWIFHLFVWLEMYILGC